MDIVVSGVCLVAGAAALGYYVWLRRGATVMARSWSVDDDRAVNNAMLTTPGVCLMLLAASLYHWAVRNPGVMLLMVLLGLGGGLLVLLAVFWRVPAMMLPAWSRDAVLGRRHRRKQARRRHKSRRQA